MNALIFVAADLVAIIVMAFGLYLPRHRRRDLVVSYIGINIGVLAVATALSSSAATAGLGLGLFGVLSIIRLRSTELTQHEVAYYFCALALGLIGGLGVEPMWLSLSLMALILGVMFIVDHPGVLRSYRAQNVVLDQAIADPAALKARLEEILGGTVHTVIVQCLDLVNDKTTVDVRFEAGTGRKTVPAPRGPLQEQLPAVEQDSLNQVRAS
ncbi:DUF4956 domain-containing protein [Arthrobacter psychrolactophilus]|uniref:DUF4956 domain-containing protein n=1 Tax=Arthrobacter psychrolactophilus TaxID=92442 RepID=A0A2V5IU74_9MICC|nr:DUF4956 domain-containing protein [Arthrobacter psychrolactophilus]PYI40055.1 DUF4956 domain-containing protein [Arthrobacter psychrolactophilus]